MHRNLESTVLTRTLPVQEAGKLAVSAELKDRPLPTGFVRSEQLPTPVVLPGKQFDGRVSALDRVGYEAEAVVFTTEGGNTIQVCDLRPTLGNNLKKVTPKSKGDVERADAAFYRDLHSYVDLGAVPKRVSGMSGIVFYSSVGGSKIRSYWLPVRPEGSRGSLVVARIGECGSASQQVAFYRNIFNFNLKSTK